MTALSPFPRRPIPVIGESVYGFERRFAACARYESLGAFREVTNLKEVAPGSSMTKFSRLAMLAGLEPQDLEFMQWRGIGGIRRGTTVVLLGHALRAGYLKTQQLRFCPSCLAEDGPPEQRIHYQAWQILQVSACPRHRSILVERCDKCARPLEHALKTKAWACACGREMTEMSSSIAPEGAVAISQAIIRVLHAQLVDGDVKPHGSHNLPQPFCDLDLDSLLTVTSKIGVLAGTPAHHDKPVGRTERLYAGAVINQSLAVQEVADLMHAAAEAVRGWPATANSLFSSLADRNSQPGLRHPVRSVFATAMGFRLLGKIKSIDGSAIRVIDDALEDWLLQERGIYIDGRHRPKLESSGDVAIDLADALRRVEGKSGKPHGISAWVEAGAVTWLGRKVSLNSVEATVEAIAQLLHSNFDDGWSVDSWSTRFVFSENYRRSNALRDILSGMIRVQRDPEGPSSGLASIRISRTDLLRCSREATKAARRFDQSPPERIKRARDRDAFYPRGKIYALLADLWPDRPPPELAHHPHIRCKTKQWKYSYRTLRQNFYSIRDSVEYMESRYPSTKF